MLQIIRKSQAVKQLYRAGCLKKQQPVIAFSFYLTGIEQFALPVIKMIMAKRKDIKLVGIYTPKDFCLESFEKRYPDIYKSIIWINRFDLIKGFTYKVNLYITPQKFDRGFLGVYSICMGYGIPAKCMSFTIDTLSEFDAFFMLSPISNMFLNELLRLNPQYKLKHVEFFNIGYPKSDDLINGAYSRETTLKRLGLDVNKKTILYAPAFNEHASLRTHGLEIIKKLASLKQYNIICKLPMNCFGNTDVDFYTGGVDWFNEIGKIINDNRDNLCNYNDYQADEVLECSDIMISCVASIPWEFMAIDKPVVFFDSPDFFKNFRYCKQFNSPQDKVCCNSGRDFGIVIKNVDALEDAIKELLNNPDKYPKHKEELTKYMYYNKGIATEVATKKILELLDSGAKSKKFYLWQIIKFYSKRFKDKIQGKP